MDKYFTNPEIANICCGIVNNKVKIDYENDLIIEPSAGNGAFIQPIRQMCKNNIFMDILPENKDVKKKDFLSFSQNRIENYQRTHIIGNPPFGFKGSMAIKFIKHACTFCDTFSFILPKSFAKESMKHSVPYHFHLIHSIDIPDNSFYYNGVVYNIPCIFQIWEKRNYMRKLKQRVSPIGYKFVSDSRDADFAIRRVGYYAGNVYFDNLSEKNINSHYFIKLQNKRDRKIIHNIPLKSNGFVVGPRSISKKDIVLQLNNMLKKVHISDFS